MPPPIPVTVVTGFLGSGKTTLINRLLRAPDAGDTAVIVNEFGEIGIDHHLVESARTDVLLMRNGCVCCSIRGDLVDTLSDLHGRRTAGVVPPFARVVVETTGLADPGPVLQTMLGEPAIEARFALNGLVATVDAIHWPQQQARHREAAAQAALADLVLLTKTDIATAGQATAARAGLAAINPYADVVEAPHGAIAPGRVLGAYAVRGAAAAHGHHGHAHDDGIRAFAVRHEKALDWASFAGWLDGLVSLRGADILRIKGLVNAAGHDGPVVVHGVHHVFHPPTILPAWPDGDRATRLVFITQGLDLSRLDAAVAATEF
ncbi:MAG: GTP-binding protein [Rhodospirillales bacterium]